MKTLELTWRRAADDQDRISVVPRVASAPDPCYRPRAPRAS
jgi:hypothetical protein